MTTGTAAPPKADPNIVNEVRAALVSNLKWAVKNKAKFGYVEKRPMVLAPHRQIPAGFACDCSTFVTLMCQWSQAPDPNGYGFNDYGNSDSIDVQLNSIALNQTWRGDLVVYGTEGATQHVAMFLQGGVKFTDPLVVSHGDGHGPTQMSISALNAGFRGMRVAYKQLIPGNNALFA